MNLNLFQNKKAYYFSLDALIAILLLIGILMFLHPVQKVSPPDMKLQDDAVRVLSAISVKDYISANGLGSEDLGKLLNTNKIITSENESLLEAIVDLYAAGHIEEGDEYFQDSNNFINNLFLDFNYDKLGLWLGAGEGEAITNNAIGFDASSSKYVWNSKQSISGIAKPCEGGEEDCSESITGYSASARLSSKYDSEYFYFGGFVGQGEITAKMHYQGEIKGVILEGAFSQNFNLYANEQLIGEFKASPDILTPVKYIINDAENLSNFVSGDNYLKFVSSSDNENIRKDFYIAGGYIRIQYKSSNNYEAKKKFYLPGIKGTINIYDSFYVPSDTLNSATLHLIHANNYNSDFTIGNVNIPVTKSDTQILDNINLADYMSLSSLAGKTTPIRYGLEAAESGQGADIIIITDLSGSMDWTLASKTSNPGVIRTNCGNMSDPSNPIFSANTQKLSLAKCLDKMAVEMLLEAPGTRVGLAGFYGTQTGGGQEGKGRVFGVRLTNDKNYLKTSINAYNDYYGTPICAGVNAARQLLNKTESPSNRRRFIILMSDGIPTYQCSSEGVLRCMGNRTGLTDNSQDWALTLGANCGGNYDDCDTNDCACGSDNTIYSADAAYKDLNATVYSIGFGPLDECTLGNDTLKNAAQVANGKYYVSRDAQTLKNIYQEIVEEIIKITYGDQEVTSNIETTLSPESYIEIDYPSPSSLSFGEVITAETSLSTIVGDESKISLNLPPAKEYLEANAISYSGNFWTNKVSYNSNQIFNLDSYGMDYRILGDPYMINIPKSLLAQGDNQISISTSSYDKTENMASQYDKAIFTIRKSFISPTPIKGIAYGCNWSINFSDGTSGVYPVYIDETVEKKNKCSFFEKDYKENDAIQLATFGLLESLDFSDPKDGIIDVKFDEQDLQISNILWDNIPYYFSTEVRISAWR